MSALSVTASGPAADAVAGHVPELVRSGFASTLFAQDPPPWGPAAEPETRHRLGWVRLPRSSRPLVGEIAALRDDLVSRGLDHVVLCGTGGSSLAAEVICASAHRPLTVLDSSDPDVVAAALRDRLASSVVVVSSTSGTTVETDSHRRAYEAALSEAGLSPAEHLVVVTDLGSPLDALARERGYRVVHADPAVGGHYSALSAVGLVPSGLAGVDVEALLDDAESVADLLAADDDGNPGLRLGAALAGTDPLRDKLALVDQGSRLVGFADWAEHLLAGSTGQQGTGILPVVVQDDLDPEVRWPAGDVTVAHLVGEDGDEGNDVLETTSHRSAVHVGGTLGAQLLLWEVATAVAGHLLGTNPFDQPDEEDAAAASRVLLDSPAGRALDGVAAATDGAVEIRALGGPDGSGGWLRGATTLSDALDSLFAQLDAERGYVAVMAYLDRVEDAPLVDCRRAIALRTERPTTFGWGPRFLHSTGQLHKGGPRTGVYLQITATPQEDLVIPARPFTFGELIAAQAAGDAAVLADHGRPVLRLHLTDHTTGLRQVVSALGLAGGAA